MPNQILRFSPVSGDQKLRTKLFGIGSAGCNIIEGAPLPTVAVSTSAADLARSHAERKFMVGQDRLMGLYGTDTDVLKQLPEIVGHELLDLFNNTDVAFIMCGLGGLTGSMGSKMVASIARAKGVMNVALVTTPFSAESFRRRELVAKVMTDLLGSCSMVIEFDNDKLSSLAPDLALSKTFGILNGIMLRPVEDIASSMARTDIASFVHVVDGATHARFGLGLSRGDERVERVVDEALSSPWFDLDPARAPAAIAIYSASDPWDKEEDRISQRLQARLPAADILWGSYKDPSLADRIRLSLVICNRKDQ
jgi:cell division protein FtsZ